MAIPPRSLNKTDLTVQSEHPEDKTVETRTHGSPQERAHTLRVPTFMTYLKMVAEAANQTGTSA
ncbi:hypothetical protein LTR66_008046 [Elasticomyces elasticus]|nr:hypothetical protein LTR66_008046 [Elasticomyces elasticus]